MTPSCSPVDPMMTRTSRARIRPFTRICCCRLNQSSWPAPREVNRSAVFICRIFPGPLLTPDTSASSRLRSRDDEPASFREPTGSSKQQLYGSKVNLTNLGRRHLAEMRGVRCVRGKIVEHRVDGRGDRFQFGEAGKDRAVADLAIDNEGRALRDLKRVKFGGAFPRALFDLRRTSALQQFR